MSLHKLTAGDGYQYLTRQVASLDTELSGRGENALSDYYSEKGERPGQWFGQGLAGLDGVTAGDQVTAEQMRALFGEGRHPNADVIEDQVLTAGGTAKAASAASALGRKFAQPAEPKAFVVECARAYEAYNAARDLPRTAAVPEQERAKIRTRIGRELFAERHGRKPADQRELSGFIARESRPREQACAGFDLTFSPVKSVSTLWAVADLDTAKVIEEAHEAAVADTIGWLERDVIFTRRGAQGARTVEVEGLLAAGFVHRDSRAGDPDLHTHVAIANKVRDPSDGAWLAVDGQVLYKHTVAASERYNTRLEAELTNRLGVGWRTVEDPRSEKRSVREIDGIDPGLMRRWSARRGMIEQQLEVLTEEFVAAHGRVPTTKEALALAQQANLETREAKHEHRSWAEQREQWRGEAVEVLGEEQTVETMVSTALNTTPAKRRGRLSAARVADLAAQVLGTVETERATFQRAHLRAEAERVLRPVGLAVDQLDDAVDQVVATAVESAIRLTRTLDAEVAFPEPLQRSDGTSVYVTPGTALFTTTTVLDAEQALREAATADSGRRASDFDVAVGILTETANGIDLNAGQRALVADMATSGRACQLALAPAGTGKTTAMRALTTAWKQGGGTVYGLAPTAVAAEELGSSIRAQADTLAKLVWHLEQGDIEATPLGAIDADAMLIIDEAGMASTPDLAKVVAFARERGAAVRLVGDDQQLAAIGAGGALRDIATEAGALTLDEVVRFHTPGEAEAGLALRDGRAVEALGFYLDQSRVRVTSPMNALDDIYTAWTADRAAGRTSLMLAGNRDTVNQLNGRAREDRLAEAGVVGPSVALTSGLEASHGDTIVTRRNRRDLRTTATDFVKNGDRWTVLTAHRDGRLTVQSVETQRMITLPAHYVASHVDLGYATTVYGAQGQTVDTSYALFDGSENRQNAYVALTRGREENVAFVQVGGDGDHHTSLTPGQVHPLSATEILQGVFERDGAAVSATTESSLDAAPARRLADAATVYADGVGHAAELLVGAQATAALASTAEELAPGITESRSWDQLARHLAIRQLAGEDPAALLAKARDSRPIEDARDLAAVHLWRLDPTLASGGPLPWLAPVPEQLATDGTHGPWLAQLTDRVTAAADQVRRDAGEWTPETAPVWARPYLEDRDLLGELAVWRAAHQISDDELRPLGSAPSGRFERRHHTRLKRRVKKAAHQVDGDWWARELGADHPELVGDAWWPVLARRLDELATDSADQLPDITPPARIDGATEDAAETGGVTEDAPETGGVTEAPATTTEQAAVDPARARIVAMHEDAQAFYAGAVADSWVPAYLQGRGLGQLVDDGSAGYAPRGPRALTDHLLDLGYSNEELVDGGLVLEAADGRLMDRFRNRLMLPVRVPGADGAEPVAFIGRAAENASSKTPKYLNTSTTAAYHKGEVLYGLAEHADLLQAGAVPVIVEGAMDAEAVTLATGGRAVGLAPGGTALTAEQVAALGEVVDLPSTPVVMATDDDTAGRKAALRGWELLLDAGVEDPRAANLAGANDPADMIRNGDTDELAAGVLDNTRPLIADVVTARLGEWEPVLDHAGGRVDAVRAIAKDVARASTEQQAYASAQLIVAIDMDPEIVVRELDNASTADSPAASVAEDQTAEEVAEDHQQADLVAALAREELQRPLPDEHPAAALWARIAARLEDPTAGQHVTRQLLDVLDVDDAAAVMATPTWPLIEQHTLATMRDGEPGQLANLLRDHGPIGDDPDTYADELLAAIAPTDSTESPRPSSRLRDQARRSEQRAALTGPGPARHRSEPRHDADAPTRRPDENDGPRL